MRLHISVSSELSQLVHACECVCPYGCICCFPQEESGAQEGSEHGECRDMGALKFSTFGRRRSTGVRGAHGDLLLSTGASFHMLSIRTSICVSVCV